MQKLQGEKSHIKQMTRDENKLNCMERIQTTNQKYSSERTAKYEKNPSNALKSNSPSN
jgi:hypothetical protein